MKRLKTIIKAELPCFTRGKILSQVITMLLRFALIDFCIFLFSEYIPPLIYKLILNSGNAFGLAMAAVCIGSGLLMNHLKALISRLWGHSAGRAALLLLCAAAVIFTAVFIPTLIRVVQFSETSATDQTTVIVLGCKVNGTEPSYALWNRTDTAVKYLETHPDAVAILSGGQGWDEGISEAECMKHIMEEAGIDESRYFVEDKSTSTDENFAFSKKIMEENTLSANVAIATHDYHQLRASIIAEKNGLTPASLPCGSVHWSKATFFTREVFGIWLQWIKR